MNKEEIVQRAIEVIDKKYGAGLVRQLGTEPIPDIDVISTGAITLDKALGIGGIPRGRITEIAGVEASGKTTTALTIIANAQKQGDKVAIIDVEHALDLSYAKMLGVNIEELVISQPDSGEQAWDIAEILVRGGFGVVVMDSIAMLLPESELKGEMSDLQVGAAARLNSKALRKLLAPVHSSNCALILINQLRSSIGGYGNPEITPGGKAIKYAASVRIDMRRKETIKDGSDVIGIRVLAKVTKNKLADPHRQAEFSIKFDRGIDSLDALIEAAEFAGVIQKRGTWLYYGETRLGQGRERAIEFLRGNPLKEEIQNQLA